MNYYELIYLLPWLKNKLAGARIVQAITPFRNFLEIFLEKDEHKYRLGFSSTPGNIALFTEYHRGAKQANTTAFFGSIYGATIADIRIAESDRWLYILFEDGHQLCFRLFSNRANAFLADGSQIIEGFKEYDKAGDSIPSPKKIVLFNGKPSGKNIRNKIIELNPMLPRDDLSDLIRCHNLEQLDDDQLAGFVKTATGYLQKKAVFRLLKNGRTSMFGEDILPVPTERFFEHVNEMIAWRYKHHSAHERLKQRKNQLTGNLAKTVQKLQSSIKNMEKALDAIGRAEEYEQWGHLLMAHAHLEAEGEYLRVQDWFNDGKEVHIPLAKKDAGIAENAQYYYKKAQNSRNSYQKAKEQLPELEKELSQKQALLHEIEAILDFREFQDWEKSNKERIEAVDKAATQVSAKTSLFYTLEVNGHPVWIGKNAKNNDLLLRTAHKEDVWMHARGVSGSHLIIRMGNVKEMPPKEVILKAAAYAAYNSKARGSELVPVMVTKAKHVRKPKGAAAGAVVVEKEEIVMVNPEKPE